MALIGAWIFGRRRVAEIDLIAGWGVACTVFTLIGVATGLPFLAVAGALLIAGLTGGVMVYRRDGRLAAAGTLRILVIALPALAIVGAMTPTQWDELVHWLPNARYLVEQDHFPAADRVPSPSTFPGYPYGGAVAIYLASRLAGEFAESAGAMFNILLLLAFALLLVRIAREAFETDAGNDGAAILASARLASGWGWCALAVLAVTALSPTFVAKIVFSAYGETPTAITAGAGLALAWFALNALAAGDGGAARRHAWSFGVVSAALVCVKQVNVVLFAALVAGAMLVALCDRRITLRGIARLAPGALIAPVVVYALWRLHLAVALPGGDFALRPASEWFWSYVPEIVERMALIASKKGGYFLIMLAAVGFGIRALRRTGSAFDRLAILTGTLFLLYNFFLLFTYVAAFGDYEAVRAASYWRYNMHLGGATLVFAAYAVARLAWRRDLSFVPKSALQAAGVAAAVAVFAAPLVLVDRFRFDLDPDYRHIREISADMARLLRPEQRVIAFDPQDNGQFLMLLRYGMHGSAQVTDMISVYTKVPPEVLRSMIDRRKATHLWLRRPDQEATLVHGLALAPGSAYLLARHNGAWSVERSWPDGAAGAARPRTE